MSWANIAYLPNIGGNVFYLICFTTPFCAELFYGVCAKTWTYLWPMVAGLLLPPEAPARAHNLHLGRVLGHAWVSIGKHDGMRPIKVNAGVSANELAHQAPMVIDNEGHLQSSNSMTLGPNR